MSQRPRRRWISFLLLLSLSSCRAREAVPQRLPSAAESSGPAEKAALGRAGRHAPSAEAPPAQRDLVEQGPQAEEARLHPAGRRDLELPGFEPALVTWPEHTEPLPVLVVAHGAGGFAEQHEQAWRSLLSEEVAILAFRGRRLRAHDPQSGYYYPDHHALNDELVALVEAALHHPEVTPHLAPFPWTYSGYSQGATMGALALVEHGAWFSRFLLIEGGSEGWSLSRAGRLIQEGRGAPQVAWVCGTESCRRGAENARSVALRAGLEAQVFVAPGGGHTYLGRVRSQVEAAWTWLYSSEAAW